MAADVPYSRKPLMALTSFVFFCASITAYFQAYEIWVFIQLGTNPWITYFYWFDSFICLANMIGACSAILYIYYKRKLYSVIVDVVMVLNYVYSFRLLFGHLIQAQQIYFYCAMKAEFEEWLERYTYTSGLSFLFQVGLQIGLHVFKKLSNVRIHDYQLVEKV
uniref:Serpentine receptor class gamma n=1 Tax=Steinernema glaseri TaxID=37863 RepID=A0A1I7YP43_9BILA